MPISAKVLFKTEGIPIDILEDQLHSEGGWLLGDETLLNVLQSPDGINRSNTYQAVTDEPFDSSWTEEDYIAFYDRLGK